MIAGVHTLAQQGTFTTWVGFYCCAVPLGFGLALAVVYFGVRYFANRRG